MLLMHSAWLYYVYILWWELHFNVVYIVLRIYYTVLHLSAMLSQTNVKRIHRLLWLQYYSITLNCSHINVRIPFRFIHDVIGDVERKKERKKDTWGNGKMKMRVASGGIRTHDTLYSGQMFYQLSYQGSSAGGVRINTCMW